MRYGVLCEDHLFTKVYLAKNRAGGKAVTVYILKDLHAARLRKAHPLKIKVNRVGISVSKKIGNAVKRNRAKRIIRQALFCIEREKPLRKGRLIVISAREGIDGLKMQDVKKEMEKAFLKLNMYEEIEKSAD